MYKVFFNEYQLRFLFENKNSSTVNIGQYIDIECFEDFRTLVESLESGKYAEELFIGCRISPNLLQQLINEMTLIPAAGGLVKNEHDQYLFIRRLGRWDLPKGKVEMHEPVRDAALREVEEECGLSDLLVLRELPPTFHMYRSPYIREKNNLVWKQTTWFEMLHTGQGKLVPQTEEDIEEVRWFGRHELDEVYACTYANLKELLRFYFA